MISLKQEQENEKDQGDQGVTNLDHDNPRRKSSHEHMLFRKKFQQIKIMFALSNKDPSDNVASTIGTQKGSTQKKFFSLLQFDYKSYNDGRFIYEQIKEFSFVQRFFGENIEDLNMGIQLCRQMKFEQFKMGQIILKQGDESNDKLYIILQGQVAIVYQKDTNVFKQENGQIFQTTHNKESSCKNENEQVSAVQLKAIIDSLGTQVNQLSVGDGFGEKALTLSPQNDFVSRGRCLTQEGKEGQFVYILVSGKVFVEKLFENNNEMNEQNQLSLKVSELSEPSFIGEEILFSERSRGIKQQNQQKTDESSTIPIQEKYLYTIKADSQLCKFFAIPKSIFLNKFPKDILADIQEKFCQKEIVRAKVFEQMKLHWLKYQADTKEAIEPVKFHLMNDNSSKEIYTHMKPQMINNYNRSILKPKDIPPKCYDQQDKIIEEFTIDFRLQQQQQNEEKQRKKILLKQQMKTIPREILKKRHSKLLQFNQKQEKPSHIPLQDTQVSKQLSQSLTSRTGNQIKDLSISQEMMGIQTHSTRVPNTSPNQQSMQIYPADLPKSPVKSDLERLKMMKNEDGSLDTIQLMSKVRYQKINIDDVTFTDIMGNNFNLYDNVGANRQFAIRPESSRSPLDKRSPREFLDPEEENQREQYFKRANSAKPSLDLGYLKDFNKILHFKLVAQGKKQGNFTERQPQRMLSSRSSGTFTERIKQSYVKKKEKDNEQWIDGMNIQSIQTESDNFSSRSQQSNIPYFLSESSSKILNSHLNKQRQIYSAVQSNRSSPDCPKKLVQSKSFGISTESMGLLTGTCTTAAASPLSNSQNSNSSHPLYYPFFLDSMKQPDEYKFESAQNPICQRISFQEDSSLIQKDLVTNDDKLYYSTPRSQLGQRKSVTHNDVQAELKQDQVGMLAKALTFESKKSQQAGRPGDSSHIFVKANKQKQQGMNDNPFNFTQFLMNKQKMNQQIRSKGSRKTLELIQSLKLAGVSPRQTTSTNFVLNNFLYS